MKIPVTRAMSREGVNAAQAFFERHGCVFQEVAQQNDFGKDAYVDIVRSGVVTHLCVAVQIKSGESFRSARGDYLIPVEGHASSWRHSTVPVFGLVYDPADRILRWVDLTGHLRANPQQEGGSIPVPRDAILDGSGLRSAFAAAVAEYASVGGAGVALKLLASEPLQADAVFDAWALGRHDARYLLLVRRLLVELRPPAVRRAIVALSHAAPHPDIFWTKDNWIPKEVEEEVQRSFRWSSEEIAHMLRVIDVEDWGRGTLGQSFDVLMYEDPNVVDKLRATVGLLLESSDTTIAIRAATVALAHSRDSRRELALLIAAYPMLAGDEWFDAVAATVQAEGYFSLY